MESKEAVLALSALAQESRLKVFRLLVRAWEEGLPAGAVGGELAISPATLSFHLGQLARAGLIEARRSGRSIIYAIRPEGIRGLMEFLMADCCERRPELCAPEGACGPAGKASGPARRRGRRGTGGR